jgi:hypothetical protein
MNDRTNFDRNLNLKTSAFTSIYNLAIIKYLEASLDNDNQISTDHAHAYHPSAVSHYQPTLAAVAHCHVHNY